MSIASGYGPNWTTAESRGLDAQRRIAELEQQLAAAQAEARNWKRIAEDATHVEREELSRVREIVSGMREYADSCDHPSEASKRNAMEYWLTQLEDALSQPAEQAPLMIRCHVCEHHTPVVFEPEPAQREGHEKARTERDSAPRT